MCSIGGFISKKPLSKHLAERLATGLLYYGAVRGDQSAGVYTDSCGLAKAAIKPDKFIWSNKFRAKFDRPVRICLTHTRFPTSGGRGNDQAQPFASNNGETVTVHNGYYFNIKELKEKWDITKPSGVDSELFTDFVNQYGAIEMGSFLESTHGVSAVAAISHGKLYLATLGNPLAYCTLRLAGNEVLVFASTVDILRKAVGFCILLPDSVKFEDIDEGQTFEALPVGLLDVGAPFGFTSTGYADDYMTDYYNEGLDTSLDDVIDLHTTDSYEYMTGNKKRKFKYDRAKN